MCTRGLFDEKEHDGNGSSTEWKSTTNAIGSLAKNMDKIHLGVGNEAQDPDVAWRHDGKL